MSFDYGVDEKLLSASENSDVKRWPKQGEMTGLFDADTVPYIVGYTSTEQEYLKFKRSSEPFFSEVWKAKIAHASYIINSALEAAGCDSAIFYLTDSANNFRLDICKQREYKGQRKAEKPPFFHELKKWIAEYHEAKISDCCEADDEISIEAWRRHEEFATANGKENLFTMMHMRFSGFVIISQDKDLKIIPGMHLPPGSDPIDKVWVTPLGWLEPKYKEVEVNDYEYWPLFDGKEVNPRNLFSFKKEEKMTTASYHELKEEEMGWEKDYIWYCLDSKAKAQEQDTFIRGAKRGEGKYRRLKMGKKFKQNIVKLSGAGLSFFYAQILTGDAVDNYQGLPGYGPKKAYDILNGSESEMELFERTFTTYKNYYRNKFKAWQRLCEQGQLAWMQTKKGEIWQPPTEEKGSFSLLR